MSTLIVSKNNVSNASGTLPVANGGNGASVVGPGLANLAGAPLLPKWRAAVAKVRAGTGNARVLLVGDSTVMGVNSAGVAATPNEYDSLAAILSAQGLPCIQQGFMGDSNSNPWRDSVDARIALGAWSRTGAALTLGGGIFTAAAGTGLSFTPTAPVDTFRVWFAANPGQGTLTIAIPGGTGGAASVTVDTTTPGANGTNVYSNLWYTTVSTTSAPGTNTVTVTVGTGTSQNVLGFEAWSSVTKSVQLINGGWGGSFASDWVRNSASYSSLNFLTSSPYDLVIFKAGINDSTAQTAIPTFSSRMQSVITAAKTAGSDVLIESMQPINPTSRATAIQQTYVDTLRTLASTNNVPFVDQFARWVDYGTSSPFSYYGDAALHPNTVGYADLASGLASTLLAPIGR